jgi:hypothetical protein
MYPRFQPLHCIVRDKVKNTLNDEKRAGCDYQWLPQR